MKKLPGMSVSVIGITILISSWSWAAPSAVVDVKLFPAGSFKGKTDEVTGNAVLSGNEVTAQNIVVSLKNLKTGIAMRDKHTQNHLETNKFPNAILVSAKGKDGVGTGKIKIKGIEHDISGTYKITGEELSADFKLHLPDFKITGIKYAGIGVDDDVVLHVKVPVKKGAAAAAAAAPTRSAASSGKAAPAKPAAAPARRK